MNTSWDLQVRLRKHVLQQFPDLEGRRTDAPSSSGQADPPTVRSGTTMATPKKNLPAGCSTWDDGTTAKRNVSDEGEKETKQPVII
jgi:hypothetical protein